MASNSLATRLLDAHGSSSALPIIEGVRSADELSFKGTVQLACDDPKVAKSKGLASIVWQCISFAENHMPEPHGLTRDEIAAIILYTAQSDFFGILHERLTKDRAALKPFLPYLRLLLTALYKLPPVGKRTLFRGAKEDLAELYTVGAEFTWWTFTSTTGTLSVVEDLLGDSTSKTIFFVEAPTGIDISKFSRSESEILLLPGTKLRVKSVIKETNTVQLEENSEATPWSDYPRPPPQHNAPPPQLHYPPPTLRQEESVKVIGQVLSIDYSKIDDAAIRKRVQKHYDKAAQDGNHKSRTDPRTGDAQLMFRHPDAALDYYHQVLPHCFTGRACPDRPYTCEDS